MFHLFYDRFLRWPMIVRILMFALTLIFAFGLTIHFVEPKTFPTIFDGVWWAVITTATVGYGDLYPVTFAGRLIGIILILSGAGVLSAYFVALAGVTATRQNAFLEGKAAFTGEKQMVIIGWNERARKVIQQLLELKQRQPIVLVDETLEANPYPYDNVYFIKGKPYQDEILKKTNIEAAEAVLITSDQHKTETEADMGAILTLIAVKGLSPDAYCIVEIQTADQVVNAKRAGADEVIQANTQASFVMLNSLISNGMSDTLLSLLNQQQKNHLDFIPVKPKWRNMTVKDLSRKLQKERKILIGVQSEDETIINPPLDYTITNEKQLFVVLEKEK
ncbi:potassium channel family protein [Weizmannia acidilactici]|uniref:potassium channel family protein n=1 Tax=Weizmannia acidilactici TaxID=2607726 RepID=UPI00124C5A9B|nr:potassium channel family protein [Weizmannia acidilactici]GER73381.1 putative potassium channel protein YugO [Weizmannia acidilactici]